MPAGHPRLIGQSYQMENNLILSDPLAKATRPPCRGTENFAALSASVYGLHLTRSVVSYGAKAD